MFSPGVIGGSGNEKTAWSAVFSEFWLVSLVLLLREPSAIPPPWDWNG
jgi:hypothetical protein